MRPVRLSSAPMAPGATAHHHFIRRAYALRTLGLALDTLMIGTVLYRQSAPASVWALLAVYGLVWPHIAWLVLRRGHNPVADIGRLTLFDAVMGGVWIALMQFNLLPSVLLMTTYTLSLVAVEGGGLLIKGMILQAAACGITAIANGFAFTPYTDHAELVASLPLLIVFPTAVGFVTYELVRRVRRQNRQLFKFSSTDGLSGLLARDYWTNAVDRRLSRNDCDSAALLLIDIDRFKRVNDRYGHTAGDDVVREIGAVIRKNIRSGDLAGRYGGDEFAVVLIDTAPEAASKTADRIRAAVSALLFDRAPGLHCTLSVGLAAKPAAVQTLPEWVQQADAALYCAKLAGRDRLTVSPLTEASSVPPHPIG